MAVERVPDWVESAERRADERWDKMWQRVIEEVFSQVGESPGNALLHTALGSENNPEPFGDAA